MNERFVHVLANKPDNDRSWCCWDKCQRTWTWLVTWGNLAVRCWHERSNRNKRRVASSRWSPATDCITDSANQVSSLWKRIVTSLHNAKNGSSFLFSFALRTAIWTIIYCLTAPKVHRNFPRFSWIRESTKFTLEIEKSIKIATNTALVIVARDCLAISLTNRMGPVLLYRCVNLIKRVRDVLALVRSFVKI